MSNVMSNTEVMKLTQELSERVTRVEVKVDTLEGKVDDMSNQFSTAMNEITKLCVNVGNLVNKMDEHITEDKEESKEVRNKINELQKYDLKQNLELEKRINNALSTLTPKLAALLISILGVAGLVLWWLFSILN